VELVAAGPGWVDGGQLQQLGLGQPLHQLLRPIMADPEQRAGRVVQHHQHPPVGQPGPVQGLALLHILGDRGPVHAQGPQEPDQHQSRRQRLLFGAAQVDVQLPVREPVTQLVGDMDGHGRLPDPGLAGHCRHHHRRPCPTVPGRGQQPAKPGHLIGAAGEVGHRRRQLARRQPLGRRPRLRRRPSEPLRQEAAGVLEPLTGGILEPPAFGPTRPRASARSRTDSPRGCVTRPCSRFPIARTLTPARGRQLLLRHQRPLPQAPQQHPEPHLPRGRLPARPVNHAARTSSRRPTQGQGGGACWGMVISHCWRESAGSFLERVGPLGLECSRQAQTTTQEASSAHRQVMGLY
jgi:hypothetical protein